MPARRPPCFDGVFAGLEDGVRFAAVLSSAANAVSDDCAMQPVKVASTITNKGRVPQNMVAVPDWAERMQIRAQIDKNSRRSSHDGTSLPQKRARNGRRATRRIVS